MSKAEERALERYPYAEMCRKKYLEGYHQAEKDLELGWDDVKAIFLLVQVEWSPNKNEEEIYQEVLKRFKERKESAKINTAYVKR